jgi:hypothetical protein
VSWLQSSLGKNLWPKRQESDRQQTFFYDSLTDDSTDSLIKTKHVKEYATNLRQVEAPYRSARGNVGLQNIGQDLDIIVA